MKVSKKKAQQLLRDLSYRHGLNAVVMSISHFLPGEKVAEFFEFVEERYSEPEDWEDHLESLKVSSE